VNDTIDRLAEYFSRFPGIGPRQARRFVYYLLGRDPSELEGLVRTVRELKESVRSCARCLRFFPKDAAASTLCLICRDDGRDASALMVVSRDVDLETVERSRSFHGYYFVLGGSLPILEKNPESRIRVRELDKAIAAQSAQGLSEIILALNVNAEGENTEEYLKERLAPLSTHNIRISVLGRGLSTGTELEYADSATIKNAVKNRA
jgi:recombination protein RecR